jgi:predicted GH43/DUF377 family glycosyl hydrolase
MKWKKLGLLFSGDSTADWYVSHAALPVPVLLDGDTYRVFFSGRDKQSRARIGFFDFLLQEKLKILDISKQPALDLGELGAFDDNGVTSSWITQHNEKYYCYYTGWSLGVTVPFYFFIGLATSSNLDSGFKRISHAPILDRNSTDAYLSASPCVLREGNLWRMWYVSGQHWEAKADGPRHYYHIKYAESKDGIQWNRTGKICIDFKNKDEYALARPCVLLENGLYRMWYSFRGEAYKIGYAESVDGIDWTRMDDQVGLEPSLQGWDSQMVEYPYVFRHKKRLFMLYNGSGYGRTGIGLAVLEE